MQCSDRGVGRVFKHDLFAYRPKRLLAAVPYLSFIALLHYSYSYVYTKAFASPPTNFSAFTDFFAPVNFILLLVIHITFCSLYFFEFAWIERFRANSLEWPWKENPEQWKKMLPRLLKSYFWNQFVGLPILHLIALHFRPLRCDPAEMPGFFRTLSCLIFFIFCEDFSFYWVHRLMHTPLLYRLIHKTHHEIYNVVYLSYAHSHWIENILANFLPSYLGALILGDKVHLSTFAVWTSFRLFETSQNHSGYEFPWDFFQVIPYASDSSYHNYHHLLNIGNYGSFSVIWDTIFRTNRDYFAKDVLDRSEDKAKSKQD